LHTWWLGCIPLPGLTIRGYLIKKSGFGYIVNPNIDLLKKLHSISESEYGLRFDESCLDPVSLAM